jgi:hypothetical protein
MYSSELISREGFGVGGIASLSIKLYADFGTAAAIDGFKIYPLA